MSALRSRIPGINDPQFHAYIISGHFKVRHCTRTIDVPSHIDFGWHKPMSQKPSLRNVIRDPVLVEALIISFLLVLVSFGLIWILAWLWVLRYALIRNPTVRPGTLLVCGHRLKNRQPTVDYIIRLKRTAKFVGSVPNLRLILLGGGEPSEAAAGRQWLLANTAVPDAAIALEQQSANSFENLRHAQKLCTSAEPVYLLSSRYHLGRLRVLARESNMPVTLLAAEPTLSLNPKNLLRTFAEASYLCWFVCGLSWARLAQRKTMLRRFRQSSQSKAQLG